MSAESQMAFEEAIRLGVLSDNINDTHFAGNYMFMGADAHGLAFKNIITRQYIHCVVTQAA